MVILVTCDDPAAGCDIGLGWASGSVGDDKIKVSLNAWEIRSDLEEAVSVLVKMVILVSV